MSEAYLIIFHEGIMAGNEHQIRAVLHYINQPQLEKCAETICIDRFISMRALELAKFNLMKREKAEMVRKLFETKHPSQSIQALTLTPTSRFNRLRRIELAEEKLQKWEKRWGL